MYLMLGIRPDLYKDLSIDIWNCDQLSKKGHSLAESATVFSVDINYRR